MVIKKIENLTKRPVFLCFNSGQTLHLGPKATSETLAQEIKDNKTIQKLEARRVIKVHQAEERGAPARVKKKR